MRTNSLCALAGVSAIALLLTSCGSSDDNKPGSTPKAGKVGVILPDATTSPRWEANDRPLLDASFKAATSALTSRTPTVTSRSSAPSATA